MPRELAGLTLPSGAMWRTLRTVAAGYQQLSAFSGHGRPPVRAAARELSMTVDDIRPEADDVISVRLVPTDQPDLPVWQPGAHLDLLLPSGRIRQYSLCGDPAQRTCFQIAVRRIADGGGGSVEVHDALRPGSVVHARGPRNAFPFIQVERYLFVAGGIGITPIRPMVHDAIRRGADWSLVYTGRTRASMPFLAELAALAVERVQVWPDDEFGVPEAKSVLAAAPDGAALYCCGPPAMIAAIQAELPAENIATLHHERFSAPPVQGGTAFEIELARSATLVPVGAGQSALAAVRAVLPDIAYSCQQGFCGTCPVRVLGGTVEHRDRCLTETERFASMAICVSRGTGRVVLDL
ncbi:MAG: PDR/VanB family oxidoreductase [Pseudonocardiales bacterium]